MVAQICCADLLHRLVAQIMCSYFLLRLVAQIGGSYASMLLFFGRRIWRSASSSDWRPVAHVVSCLSSEYCFDLC